MVMRLMMLPKFDWSLIKYDAKMLVCLFVVILEFTCENFALPPYAIKALSNSPYMIPLGGL